MSYELENKVEVIDSSDLTEEAKKYVGKVGEIIMKSVADDGANVYVLDISSKIHWADENLKPAFKTLDNIKTLDVGDILMRTIGDDFDACMAGIDGSVYYCRILELGRNSILVSNYGIDKDEESTADKWYTLDELKGIGWYACQSNQARSEKKVINTGVIKVLLFDENDNLVEAWKEEFKGTQGVAIKKCSLSDLKFHKVVTPGNSFGWMTGGMDLAVRNKFGVGIQDRIQEMIMEEYNGYLPVGESVESATLSQGIDSIIYAPTMVRPGHIDPLNVFIVFVQLLRRYNCFACCGLGTGAGEVDPKVCAHQMKLAWNWYMNDPKNNFLY